MAVQQLAPWNGAHNAAATAANTGFASIVKTDTAGTLTFKNTWMPRGLNSLEMVGTTTPGYVLGVIEPGTTTDTVAIDVPVMPLALPSAEHYLASFHQVSDDRQFSVSVYPDGAVRFRDDANVGSWGAGSLSAAGVMAVGVPVLLRMFGTRDAAAGQIHIQILNFNDNTVRADTTLQTGKNTGISPVTHVKLAAKGSSASTLAAGFAFGVPRYDFAATGLIPLWTEPPAPVAFKPFRHSTGSAWATPHDVVFSDGTSWKSIAGMG